MSWSPAPGIHARRGRGAAPAARTWIARAAGCFCCAQQSSPPACPPAHPHPGRERLPRAPVGQPREPTPPARPAGDAPHPSDPSPTPLLPTIAFKCSEDADPPLRPGARRPERMQLGHIRPVTLELAGKPLMEPTWSKVLQAAGVCFALGHCPDPLILGLPCNWGPWHEPSGLHPGSVTSHPRCPH